MQNATTHKTVFKPTLSFDCGVCEINLDNPSPYEHVQKKEKQVVNHLSSVSGSENKLGGEVLNEGNSMSRNSSSAIAPAQIYTFYTRNHPDYSKAASAAALETKAESEREPKLIPQPMYYQRQGNDVSVKAEAQVQKKKSFADTIADAGSYVDPKEIAALRCGHLFHAVCLQTILSPQSVAISKFFNCPKCNYFMGINGIIRAYPTKMDIGDVQVGPTAKFLNGDCPCENATCKNYWDQSRYISAEEHIIDNTESEIYRKIVQTKKLINASKPTFETQRRFLSAINRKIKKYKKMIDDQNLTPVGGDQ